MSGYDHALVFAGPAGRVSLIQRSSTDLTARRVAESLC
jgi:hypothetical protein